MSCGRDGSPAARSRAGPRFFTDVVEPPLSRALPGLRYAAARLGSGSDVLGLDDAMSRDHDWGCRLTLLVDEDARDQVPRISAILEEELPERFGEFPVRFPVTWDSSLPHQVEVATVADFTASRLGVDPSGRAVGAGLAERDRAERARGDRRPGVHRPDPHPGGGPDAAGLVSAGRRALRPGGGLAAPLPAAADGGPDRRGRRRARLAAAQREPRRGPARLAFALSRRWAPYAKWRGTVFRSLPVAARLGPLLDARRSAAMAGTRACADLRCGSLLGVQRERGLPTPESAVIPFYDRPTARWTGPCRRHSSTASPTRTSHGCRRWWAPSSSGSTPPTSCPARAAGRLAGAYRVLASTR